MILKLIFFFSISVLVFAIISPILLASSFFLSFCLSLCVYSLPWSPSWFLPSLLRCRALTLLSPSSTYLFFLSVSSVLSPCRISVTPQRILSLAMIPLSPEGPPPHPQSSTPPHHHQSFFAVPCSSFEPFFVLHFIFLLYVSRCYYVCCPRLS